MLVMKVYIADLNCFRNQSGKIAQLNEKLSESDAQRYLDFNNENRKLQFLVGHAMVFDVLKKCPWTDENGRLCVQGAWVSLAHRDSMVVLAIDDEPVGVDVENTEITRDFPALNAVLGYDADASADTFYRNFVRGEAVLKRGCNDAWVQYWTMGKYLIALAGAHQKNEVEWNGYQIDLGVLPMMVGAEHVK